MAATTCARSVVGFKSIMVFVVLQISICGSVDFRDRIGNTVTIENSLAILTEASSGSSYPIITEEGKKVFKIDGDPQRNYVLMLSTDYVGLVNKKFGNLHIAFVDDLRLCNGSVISYKLIDGYVVNDIRIDKTSGLITLDMGNYGRPELKRNFFTFLLAKLNLPGDPSEDPCLAMKFDLFARSTTANKAGQNKPNKPEEGENNRDTSMEGIIEDILGFHNETVTKLLTKIQHEEEAVYTRLNLKINQVNRLQYGNTGSRYDEKPPKRSPPSLKDFKDFLDERFLRYQRP